MPNSFRVRTQLGANRTIPVKLDQDYDSLEILSLAIYPNNVYTRSCSDYGVICGRVFANKGYGVVNARVAVFIPISPDDESNPLISTLYPYKGFEDFNEDGYKFNLLPYTPSHSGHVAVGTFPERIDALTNPTVVEVYDKYYKFTAKTNDAGDYMIFGLPLGQHDIIMQVDLSDIGEFSLTPQDLIRMGRATESQVNGTKFKFSENYSELPQIVTLKKVVQVSSFFGQDGVCQHFITRADFDLTSEGGIEFQPTAVFIGSMFSSTDKKKLKKRCRVPAKQGWLCDLITGPGQIETIRQTIFTDSTGRPVLENFKLQNDGKLIDENGTWMIELPMNLDYVYTDENGIRRVSPDGKVGVPVRAKYRFKVKWQQSPSLSEETKRAYFLVPNIKEHGWISEGPDAMIEPSDDPNSELSYLSIPTITINIPPTPPLDGEEPSTGPFLFTIPPTNDYYYNVVNTNNIESYTILVDGIENPDYYNTIPMPQLSANTVVIRYNLIDATIDDISISFRALNTSQYLQQCSYAFSLSWPDYGNDGMIQEAINCEDRFYEFQYNKVYTISQLLDRYTNRLFPQKSIQVKHILDDNCEGEYNTFPTNDVYYRYNLLFILANVILSIMKFVFLLLVVFLHVLAFLWPVFALIITIVWAIQTVVYKICKFLRDKLSFNLDCKEPKDLSDLLKNPFKNVRLPLFLYTEDGCERCRCKVVDQDLDEESNTTFFELNQNLTQLNEGNVSSLADLNDVSSFTLTATTSGFNTVPNGSVSAANYGDGSNSNVFNSVEYTDGLGAVVAGNSAAAPLIRKIPFWRGSIFGANVDLFSTSLPIAEKLNLFNTKAKYFDNLTTQYGTNNTPSPGNVGWNQVYVTINPDENDYEDFYHTDNLLVLLVDSTAFTRGTIITFQDPNESTDVNNNSQLFGTGNFSGTSGVILEPESYTVRYANPDVTSSEPLLTTIYNMDGAYGNGLPGLQFSDGSRPGRTCYPSDIEYYQVIQDMTYAEFLCISSTGENWCDSGFDTPSNTSDRRFSLPWRFMRSDRPITNLLADLEDYVQPTSDNLTASAQPSASWANATIINRTYTAPNPGCQQACWNETTHILGQVSPWNQFLDRNPNVRVIFVQRGVDINSPFVEQRFDLRRFFGIAPDDWTADPIINGNNISQYCVVQARFKLNQPILPGGIITNGFNVFETSGWRMNGIVRNYFANGTPNVSSDYQFLAVLGQTVTQTNGPDTDQLGPLVKSTSSFVDDNGIFDENTRILTPQETGEYSITVFLRFSGSFFQNGGVQVILRDYTTSTNLVLSTSDTLALNLVQGPYNDYIVDLIEGHEYRLLVANLLVGGDVTYYADENEWVTDNPNGLILPKHHLITDNEQQQIYFPSQFYRFNNDYVSYDTTMPTYYSALDSETVIWGYQEFGWRDEAFLNLAQNGIEYDNGFAVISEQNGFRALIGRASDDDDGYLYIPCHSSNMGLSTAGAFENSKICGDAIQAGETGGQNYVCEGNDRWEDENRLTACPGCCRYRENLRNDGLTYHQLTSNATKRNLSGYQKGEYVEGGSALAVDFVANTDFYQRVYSTTSNCFYEDPEGQPPQWGPNEGDPWEGGGNCEGGRGSNNRDSQARQITWNNVQYISPVYASFRPDVPPPGNDIPENQWYVNPNHYVTMSNRFYQVMRTDRLPSSTDVQEDGNGNGYLLHQNGGFSMYIIGNCDYEQEGGGELITPVFVDLDFDVIPGGADGPIANVAASLTNCAEAVDLNSYYTDADENPAIQPGGDGYSSEPATGADWLWFVRGTGCYNVVSKPLRSLFFHDVPAGAGNPDPGGAQKRYSDFATVVEWIQRLKLTFSLCFDVYSHTFSNNWINGTLYAFAFQNATRFDSQNRPTRSYCRDTIYFHDPLNNYYYRSSPWDGTNFVGRPRYLSSEERVIGNVKNLLFPTTLIDLGPKAGFIQELVYSDDYDGYIVPRIPTSTFQDVTDILNLFVLSRLVNTSFIQQLFPLPDNSGNEQGGDDPSVGAFFKNSRWQNGQLFFSGLLPGLVDADYSQMISINSEFGVNEFSPENYTNNDIIFAEDTVTPTYPYFGIFFSGDNQLRDYITPRRTIWNANAPLPPAASGFTQIAVKTQVVPFYQWNVFHNLDSPQSLFGTQSNNFITNFPATPTYVDSSTFPNGFFAHGYQTLDRFGPSSEYFVPGVNNTFYYKGYLINYSAGTDSDGNPVVIAVNRIPSGTRYRYTFGAPFHFYFGLKQGASAMDRFIQKYVDTNIIYE
jgi:hypothetical protein